MKSKTLFTPDLFNPKVEPVCYYSYRTPVLEQYELDWYFKERYPHIYIREVYGLKESEIVHVCMSYETYLRNGFKELVSKSIKGKLELLIAFKEEQISTTEED
jgi:hypothetical protein